MKISAERNNRIFGLFVFAMVIFECFKSSEQTKDFEFWLMLKIRNYD